MYLCNNTKNYNTNDNHNNNSYCLLRTKHSANQGLLLAYKPHLDHYTFDLLIALSRPNLDIQAWNDKLTFLAWESCLSAHSSGGIHHFHLYSSALCNNLNFIAICTYFTKMRGMEKGKCKSAGFNDE